MTETAEHLVEAYLTRLAEIRSTGGATSETSFYSALETLLNGVGQTLDPHVICNGQLRNQGAGHPDFGLYTRKQCNKGEPKPGQGEVPARGVVEVKPLGDKTWQTAKGKQATKYFDYYRLVLLTNYREFRLIGEGEGGKPEQREYLNLADSESEFWAAAAHPKKFAKEQAEHFIEFLRRVLMNAAPLTTAEDVAWFLASYARDALVTLETKDAAALGPLRQALETALGIKFEGEKGEHFFRSTLVQTLFYGVFSAWVVWARKGSAEKFDWRHAGFILTVPMVRTLFEEIAKPSRLKPLGLMDTLDRTGEALQRIDEAAFFKSFDTGQAIQHFYEPFLEAFDPQLRKEMGVWYTPPEIVRYIVARVDTALRTELNITDGLADKNVYVLDPCCGTGTFLVEVLRRIEDTLRSKSNDPLIGEDVKEAARTRIFGFEILSAPFVVAHWRVGDLLASVGLDSPFDASKGERPAIYLTNALTGWQPPKGPKATLSLFPELEEERDHAEHVKRDVPILVILGNPPYNAFAGKSPDMEQGLVEPYKKGLIQKWGIKKFNLDELYVRFFRIAERRINQTGRGIVSYISNYSYVSEPSFVVMRENLLASFDKFWIDNMHGDRHKSEYAPDGKTSETVFAMRGFSPGIRQGVVISLAVKTGTTTGTTKTIRFRDDLNMAKAEDRRAALVASLSEENFDSHYEAANPQPWNRLSFRPGDVGAHYLEWPRLVDLCGIAPPNGLMEKRNGALIDFEKAPLSERMKAYYDKKLDWNAYRLVGTVLSRDAARFDAEAARKKVLKEEGFDSARIVNYLVRPFDERYAYYTGVRPIWNEPRPQLWDQYRIEHNSFLMSRMVKSGEPEGPPFYFTQDLGDDHALRTDAYFFAALYEKDDGPLLGRRVHANLSDAARAYLTSLKLPEPDSDRASADAIWLHALAIGFSPLYLSQNADGLAIDWPRIPLPKDVDKLKVSATRGTRIAHLFNRQTKFETLFSGKVPTGFQEIGALTGKDLALTASWGHADNKGRINPGAGDTTERDWTTAEKAALSTVFADLKVSTARGLELLGGAVDVRLNDNNQWRGVPMSVWEYYIGGYQVIKKWLSYRDYSILERALSKDEARKVTSMIRRLTLLVLMGDDLDNNYKTSRDNAYTFGAK